MVELQRNHRMFNLELSAMIFFMLTETLYIMANKYFKIKIYYLKIRIFELSFWY